ncbi:MAG: transposase [Oscillospiraceae bacterium]|nr:transposase [Oscillospiraceae bacterium]
MPRQARVKSESGIYHIMLRGINQQQIFEDKEDNLKFLEILSHYKEVCGYKVYAYCLMGNHLHLLIKEGNAPLEEMFKRICGRFVYWYNVKYGRSGHLFQDRFRSEPVDKERYLFTVLRYIHQNPVKAGLCETVDAYPYSSFREYLGGSLITDTSDIFQLISLASLIQWHRQLEDTPCLDIPDRVASRMTDEHAKALIHEHTGCDSAADFQRLAPHQRDRYLSLLRKKGISLRQLSRLTGISINIVRNL